MARIFSEGFEVQDYSHFTVGYAANGITYTTGRTGGRGSYCAVLNPGPFSNDNTYFSKDLGANYDELYVRAYYRNADLRSLTSETIRFLDSAGTDVLSLRCYNNTLYAYRTTSSLGDITPVGWASTTWTLFEVYAKCVSGETILTIKLDGAQIYTATWAETTGAGNLRTVQFMYYAKGGAAYFDDIAINDTSGSANNSWVGNGSIVALVPTSTAVAEMQGSDGNQTDNHLLVDELPKDDDTTYVYSDVEAEDTYGLTNLAALASGESINGLWTSVRARKEGASTLGMRAGTLSGTTTTYETTETTLVSSYVTYYGVFREVDPDTSAAWSESAVNALQLLAGVL